MEFGTLADGRAIERVTIGAEPGVVLDVLTFGATAWRVQVSDRDGVRRDVALGRDTVEQLVAGGGHLGGTIGRFANRIAGGRFPLDGREIEVAVNDRGNALHGGAASWDKQLWTIESHDTTSVTLSLVSPDGDNGFPGTVTATVTYTVEGDTVSIALGATTDAPTVVSMTNHAYFNLDGDGAGTIDGHLLAVYADHYLPLDPTGIPLGDPAPVDGTPFDLRSPALLGPVARADHPQLSGPGGLDHNFVLSDSDPGGGSGLRAAARLVSPATGLAMELWTDLPGLQVYTGNSLGGAGRAGSRYRVGDGIALEPQLPPDTPNHAGEPGWPSARLAPGERYSATLEWRFGRA